MSLRFLLVAAACAFASALRVASPLGVRARAGSDSTDAALLRPLCSRWPNGVEASPSGAERSRPSEVG